MNQKNKHERERERERGSEGDCDTCDLCSGYFIHCHASICSRNSLSVKDMHSLTLLILCSPFVSFTMLVLSTSQTANALSPVGVEVRSSVVTFGGYGSC